MNNFIKQLKLHWPVILSALSSIYAILVDAGTINTNNKTVATVIAIVSTIVYTVFHVRLVAPPTINPKV